MCVYYTVLYVCVLYCMCVYYTVLYVCVLYCTVCVCTVLYVCVLYCTVCVCTVLYVCVLYCTVCVCTILYCMYTCVIGPGWLKNLYFTYLVVLKAVVKGEEVWRRQDVFHTLDNIEDTQIREDISTLVEAVKLVAAVTN